MQNYNQKEQYVERTPRERAIDKCGECLKNVGENETTVESVIGALIFSCDYPNLPAIIDIPRKVSTPDPVLWAVIYRHLNKKLETQEEGNNLSDPLNEYSVYGSILLDHTNGYWQSEVVPWARDQGIEIDFTYEEIAANLVNIVAESAAKIGFDTNKIVGLQERLIKPIKY